MTAITGRAKTKSTFSAKRERISICDLPNLVQAAYLMLGFAVTKSVSAQRAKQLFSCVLSYVSKSVEYIAQTDELLRSCAAAEGAAAAERDEVLCQLVVMLTGAEDLNEMTRCWQLFSLCLRAFAPSEGLLNRIDNFMRREEEDTCLGEVRCVARLCSARAFALQACFLCFLCSRARTELLVDYLRCSTFTPFPLFLGMRSFTAVCLQPPAVSPCRIFSSWRARNITQASASRTCTR